MSNTKVNEIINEIISISNNYIYLKLPFMGLPIGYLKYEQYEGEIGTDGKAIYYDYKYLLEIFKENPIHIHHIFLHSMIHCIFKHFHTSIYYNSRIWDLACDICVENILLEINCSQYNNMDIKTRELIKIKKSIPLLTADKIYSYLMQENMNLDNIVNLEKIFKVDEHSIWLTSKLEKSVNNRGEEKNEKNNGKKRSNIITDNSLEENSENGETSKDTVQYGDASKEAIKYGETTDDLLKFWSEASDAIRTFVSTQPDNIAANSSALLKNLEYVNRRQYNYREFIQQFSATNEVMKLNHEEFDYIFYTYGLQLYENIPLIEPIEYREEKVLKEFIIAIDTSGSVDEELVRKFLQITYDVIMNSVELSKTVHLRIIQCDCEIHEDYKITSKQEFEKYMKNFQVKGMGNTDFRPVFHRIEERQKKGELKNLKGMLYFTDGLGEFPTIPTKYKTAFVFVEDEWDYNNYNVPNWAIKLIIPKEQFEGEN